MTTVNPCVSLPLSGSSVEIPFPDIAKPVPGGWTVSITLRSTATLLRSPPNATISVMQGGKTLASLPITPSTSSQTYNLSISDSEIDQGTDGLCQIAALIVIITDDSPSCCPSENLPPTLNVHLACHGCADSPVGCPCWTDFDTIIKYDKDLGIWAGEAQIPGCDSSYQLGFWCDNFGRWNFRVHDCETDWSSIRVARPEECDPLEIPFGLGISTACCLNPSGSSYPVIGTITA